MNLYVIIGEDDYLVSEAAKKAAGGSEGLEVIDSRTSTNEEARLRDLAAADASFSTPPFLEPRKVTWWKNVAFLPASGGPREDKPSEAVKEALERFAQKLAREPLPDNQVFILSGPRLLATSVFAKTLKAVGEMIVFAEPKRGAEEAAAARAEEAAAAAGFRFAPGAVAAFISTVGCDTRSIFSEAGKLRDYLGDRVEATSADVEAVSVPGVGIEHMPWAITDALAARNLPAVLKAAKPFEADDNFAILVSNLAEKLFRQLFELVDARQHDKLSEATKSLIAGGVSSWAIQKLVANLGKWTVNELRIARYRFLRLRELAVSSSGETAPLAIAELVRACRSSARSRL